MGARARALAREEKARSLKKNNRGSHGHNTIEDEGSSSRDHSHADEEGERKSPRSPDSLDRASESRSHSLFLAAPRVTHTPHPSRSPDADTLLAPRSFSRLLPWSWSSPSRRLRAAWSFSWVSPRGQPFRYRGGVLTFANLSVLLPPGCSHTHTNRHRGEEALHHALVVRSVLAEDQQGQPHSSTRSLQLLRAR